jgi:hypothetical protein
MIVARRLGKHQAAVLAQLRAAGHWTPDEQGLGIWPGYDDGRGGPSRHWTINLLDSLVRRGLARKQGETYYPADLPAEDATPAAAATPPTLGADLTAAVRRLADHLDAPTSQPCTSAGTADGRSTLAAVVAALRVSRLADKALRTTVDRARAAGQTWQQIGDTFGTTRQAAFQRFGHPADPRMGAAMPVQALPGAGGRAVALFTEWASGHWEQVRADFDPTMARQLDADGIAAAWAQVVAMVGGYEHMGEPFIRRQGGYTVVDVPLEFEAGSMKGRVAYDGEGRVAGLFVLTPQAP